MITKVLFIQGGGAEAHAWDAKLASSLAEKLGPDYEVIFPEMPNEADPNYLAWKGRIQEQLQAAGDGTVLVGHSIGASMLMKMLAEGDAGASLKGVFLVAAPFVHARKGWQWKEAELPVNASGKLPGDLPLFLYHGQEDEEVPFAHLALYMETFPRAVGRALPGRNHQINDDLTEVAEDIRKAHS
jgi:predicted alpha/beta hydrolase family esterase